MGDGRIFLKSRRDVSFKKGLSNYPTLGLIHLAGQYLKKILVNKGRATMDLLHGSRGVSRLNHSKDLLVSREGLKDKGQTQPTATR